MFVAFVCIVSSTIPPPPTSKYEYYDVYQYQREKNNNLSAIFAVGVGWGRRSANDNHGDFLLELEQFR
jgi:hypothetical protein